MNLPLYGRVCSAFARIVKLEIDRPILEKLHELTGRRVKKQIKMLEKKKAPANKNFPSPRKMDRIRHFGYGVRKTQSRPDGGDTSEQPFNLHVKINTSTALKRQNCVKITRRPL